MTHHDYDHDPAIPCPVCEKPLKSHTTAQLMDCRYMAQHELERRVYGATTTTGDVK